MGRAVRKKSSSSRRRPTSSQKPRRKKPIRAKESKQDVSQTSFARECASVSLVVIAVFLGVSIFSFLSRDIFPEPRFTWPNPHRNTMGPLGAYVSGVSVYLLGWCSYSLSLWAILLSRAIWVGAERENRSTLATSFRSAIASVVMVGSCAVFATVVFGYRGGGRFGSQAAHWVVNYVNEPGAILISVSLFLLSLGAASEFSLSRLLASLKELAVFLVAIGADILFLIAQFTKWSLSSLRSLFVFSLRGIAAFLRGGFELAKRRHVESLIGENAGVLDTQRRTKRRRERKMPDLEEVESSQELDAEDRPFVLGTERGTSSKRPAVNMNNGRQKKQVEEFSQGEEQRIEEDAPFQLGELPDAEVKISRREISETDAPPATSARKPTPKLSRAGGKRARSYEDYEHPAFSLLVGSEGKASTGPQDDQLLENSKKLEEALKNFRIGGRVKEVHPGPVVTLYEFAPAAGVKVQRIINLADDLALALKVASVRVYAPVPGKGTVGVEVPNPQREIVRLRDVLESESWKKEQLGLPLALGKDTYGVPFATGLPRMPHLLIAGATGTGKSVCINSLLLSLLYRHSPDELNLILIDPKMLELSVYEDIPHLKAPVVTNAKRAKGVLWWAVEEMERRYRLLKDVGVRDLAAYNRLAAEGEIQGAPKGKRRKNVTVELQERDVVATGSPYEGLDRGTSNVDPAAELPKVELERLPRVVVVVDELADLMLSVGREIEDLLARLAQKARAAGIHLIVATQRPSVNVITGLIKANFPARISFKVASKIDARTVMDTSGAERLLGQGDMLFVSPTVGQVRRLHSPYVSDQEVHDVVDWIRTQGKPDYDTSIEEMISKISESDGGSRGFDGDNNEYDEFYDRAVTLVIDKGQASTSMVQRAFRIGYNRAARILETMEREGVVGPADGSKPRQVLVGSIDGA